MLIISYLSAIVTCILFVLYVIGHIWSIKMSKSYIFEKVEIETGINEEQIDLEEIYDGRGEVCSVYSSKGIKQLSIYDVVLKDENSFEFCQGDLIKNISLRRPFDKFYFKVEFFEFNPNICLEIERLDYVKMVFMLSQNGKNGNIEIVDEKYSMPFRSWVYYLCR